MPKKRVTNIIDQTDLCNLFLAWEKLYILAVWTNFFRAKN